MRFAVIGINGVIRLDVIDGLLEEMLSDDNAGLIDEIEREKVKSDIIDTVFSIISERYGCSSDDSFRYWNEFKKEI